MPKKKFNFALAMKPVKNLVSNQGECQSVNPLTGFVGAMTGNMEKARLMGSHSGNRSLIVDSARMSASSQQVGDVPNFYDMSIAPQVSVGPFTRGAEFQTPFYQNQPMMRPPMQSFGQFYPMAAPYAHTPQVSDMSAAKRMVELMRNSGNPKFANSNFVEFIDQVASGNLQFEPSGSVVDRSGQPVDWDALYSDSDALHDDGGLPDQMEQIWNALRGSSQIDELVVPTYDFQHQDNAYLESSENLLLLAVRLIGEGRDSEAIKVLEAEVRVNSASSEGWRMLGELHAQFDQDTLAIACLEQGHLCDSFNLDSMLALGVSLTNELDSIRALSVLNQWIRSHESFFHLAVPEGDYMQFRRDVLSSFLEAQKLQPDNPDIAIALGVLYNISREYSLAIPQLMQAAKLRPTDFSVWNKLGATLANSGLSRESLLAYNQALLLKPNYPRAWANLAIAHTNLNEYEEASKNFLMALQISPSSSHLWSSLFLALSNFAPDRTELADFIENRNLDALVSAIGAARVSDLPKPTTSVSDQVLLQLSEDLKLGPK